MKVSEAVVYGASLLGAAWLPSWMSFGTSNEPAPTAAAAEFPESGLDVRIDRIAAYLESKFEVLASSIRFFRQRREFILALEEARLNLVRYDVVTAEHNAVLANLTLNQAEQLLALNTERMAFCAKELAEITKKRAELTDLEQKLAAKVKTETKRKRSQSGSLSALKASLKQMRDVLIPEGKREYERLRRELLEAYAELHTVTSDRHYRAEDMDQGRLDELIKQIETGEMSLDDFRAGIESNFRNGLRRVTKPKESSRSSGNSTHR